MLKFLSKERKREIMENEEKQNQVSVNEEPRICLFDFSKEVAESLITNKFNCMSASLGTQLSVANKRQFDNHICYLNHYIPENLHEFQICAVDLTNETTCDYEVDVLEDIQRKAVEKYFFCCEYPATIFDPRPIASNTIKDRIRSFFDKEFVLIVFADKKESIDYKIATLSFNGYQIVNQVKYSNYDFADISHKANKFGTITNVMVPNSAIGQLLKKYNDQITYQATFHHPIIWKNNKNVKLESFIPLLTDIDNEIVSYVQGYNKGYIFVFPQIANKEDFLKELLGTVLPSILPQLFPYSTQFSWLSDEPYNLPNIITMQNEKQTIIKKYEEMLNEIEQKVKANYEKYKFLHDMLTETGDKLVKAVEQYLKWLGFADVINVDETEPNIKEEDLQVVLDDGLLVVEVKGIGGTSTDGECSQISKIRYRRSRERKKFDVKALYIVNHQRYLPPENRVNPPFTDNQIKDANDDNRGLLTTYELFKIYFLIEENIFTKEYIRQKLQDYGVITFEPQGVFLGVAEECFKEGYVVILNIKGITIKSGDEILVRKDGKYLRRIIKNIQIDGDNVSEVSNGEIGIELDRPISRKSEIFLP